MFRTKKKKEKKKKKNMCSAPVTRRVCCVSDKSRSGNSRKLPNAPASEFTSTTTATLTRTRATMWQHVSRRYTSARRLAAARARTICAMLERYTYTHTIYVPTKMRIHFLQNVSHSAAHYRRNEKGMMRGGKLGRRKTFGLERRRGREREETVRERRRRRTRRGGGEREARRRTRRDKEAAGMGNGGNEEGREEEGKASLNIS